jgi:hypothetical protein
MPSSVGVTAAAWFGTRLRTVFAAGIDTSVII